MLIHIQETLYYFWLNKQMYCGKVLLLHIYQTLYPACGCNVRAVAPRVSCRPMLWCYHLFWRKEKRSFQLGRDLQSWENARATGWCVQLVGELSLLSNLGGGCLAMRCTNQRFGSLTSSVCRRSLVVLARASALVQITCPFQEMAEYGTRSLDAEHWPDCWPQSNMIFSPASASLVNSKTLLNSDHMITVIPEHQ